MRDKSANKKVAVKCYHWNDPVLESRYQYLSDIKKNNDLSFIVPCKFIPNGTNIQGATHPVLLMDWIDGVPFREFIFRAAGVPRILDKLARLVTRIERKMYKAGIAHCGIEPDHIMLGSNASDERGVLILLDYDNFWFPSLAHRNILEAPDPDYQHPGRIREGIYGPLADRFPLFLLYVSLTAIRVMGPKFLKEKAPEHGLLFSKRDLENPNDAQIFKELLGQKDPFLRGLTLELQDSLARPMAWIPKLEESINRITEEAEKGAYGWAEVHFNPKSEPSIDVNQEDEAFGLKKTVSEMAANAAVRIQHGDFETGIQLYMDCCERDPGNLPCRKKLRDAQMKSHDNKPPSGFGIGRSTKSRVQGWQKSGNHAKALEAGEEGLTANPWDSSALRVMGRSADALGHTETASWLFQSALKISPNDLEILQDLAEFLERQQDFRSARILWEKIVRLNPSDQDAKDRAKELGASETMKRMSDNKDVVISPQKEVNSQAEEQRIRLLLQEKPHWGPYYIELANLLKKANRLEEAENTLRLGIAQSEGDKKLVLEVAHFEKMILAKRIEEIKQILSEDKAWPFAKITEDCLQTEQRRRDSELLRLRVEADPANMISKFELGQMLVELGDIDAAITELQQSRKDPRLAWKALVLLGKCFSQKGNSTLARRNLEDALKSLPASEEASRKEILFSLAQNHAAEGNFAKAVEIGNDIANIDYSYQGIGKLLDEWIARSKKT